MLGKQVAFGGMGVPGQDECADPYALVCLQLGGYLIRIADNRCAGAASGPADACPQVVFDEAVISGAFAERCLTGHTE